MFENGTDKKVIDYYISRTACRYCNEYSGCLGCPIEEQLGSCNDEDSEWDLVADWCWPQSATRKKPVDRRRAYRAAKRLAKVINEAGK